MAEHQKRSLTGWDIEHQTGAVINCPNCLSRNIRFRVTRGLFFCNRCAAEWDRAGNVVPITEERK